MSWFKKQGAAFFEEVIVMKNSILNLEKSIGKIGYQITKKNINSACCMIAYQDKLPETVKKLRKF